MISFKIPNQDSLPNIDQPEMDGMSPLTKALVQRHIGLNESMDTMPSLKPPTPHLRNPIPRTINRRIMPHFGVHLRKF